MRNYVIIAVICLGIISCTKNKFSSTPKLTYKSVNTDVLDRGQIISFKLSYTDAEGDLQDTIFVQKVEPTCALSGFTSKYVMPAFPVTPNSEGEITVSFGYNVDNYPLIKAPQCGRNDTCYFRFMLKDKAQHKSDTVNSGQIIIIK
jgi:hypothetical protein